VMDRLAICLLVGLSVCLSVCPHCGKTAEWIQMPLGMVSGVGRETGVLDGMVIIEGTVAVLRVNFWLFLLRNQDTQNDGV